MDTLDPLIRMTNDSNWERHMLAELPSRQRLALLQHEHARQRRVTGRPACLLARRFATRIGGELTYRFRLQRGSPSCPQFWCTGPNDGFRLSELMSASTGEVRTINKVLGGGRRELRHRPAQSDGVQRP